MNRQVITKILKVNANFPELEKIRMASDFLNRGGIIAFPTETVYGLGVNLTNERAVRRLYEIKERSANKPLTIHISFIEKMRELADRIPDFTFKLTEKFWPGPLTLILYGKHNDKTIGFRFPKHRVALGIINESRAIVGATSANISNLPAAKSADEVLTHFNGLIDMIVDGGAVGGMESTILDLTCFPPKIIREGAVGQELRQALSEILKVKTKTILLVCTGNSCRSPMAKGYLRHILRERNDIDIISAGTAAPSGRRATPEAIKVMADVGVDISGHLVRRLSDEMIHKADLILVMEEAHKEEILKRVPEAKGKVYLLKEFGREEKILNQQEDLDIADPIGKPLEFYQKCFTIIKEELERIAKLL